MGGWGRKRRAKVSRITTRGGGKGPGGGKGRSIFPRILWPRSGEEYKTQSVVPSTVLFTDSWQLPGQAVRTRSSCSYCYFACDGGASFPFQVCEPRRVLVHLKYK